MGGVCACVCVCLVSIDGSDTRRSWDTASNAQDDDILWELIGLRELFWGEFQDISCCPCCYVLPVSGAIEQDIPAAADQSKTSRCQRT